MKSEGLEGGRSGLKFQSCSCGHALEPTFLIGEKEFTIQLQTVASYKDNFALWGQWAAVCPGGPISSPPEGSPRGV